MINYKTMYKLKNYLLSMQSHWMINQPTYQAVQDTIPLIAKYKACLLYTSPSPRDGLLSRMPSSA